MKRRITLTDLYKEYPYRQDPTSKYYVDQKKYRKINEDFYTLLISMLVNTGETYKLPYGFGELKIRKRKNIATRVDFKRTKEYNNKIMHNNMHSNEYYARFKWYKSQVYLQNKAIYKFNPIRWAKRYLAQQIKDKNTIIHYSE